MNKVAVLKNFISNYEHLPEQGSDKWKLNRYDTIGGSELPTVLKQNKYKSINKLIMEKLNITPFDGNIITQWGNIFEELIRLYSQDEFKCYIYETGSIPYKKGYLSYSPDGLSVISKSVLSKYINIEEHGLDDNHNEYLTLFEFKCPHSRIPDNNIPEYYIPQIMAGMNIINIMETGLFIQAVFRKCLFRDISYNKNYIEFGHFKKLSIDNNPLETGFMVMYNDDPEYVKELIEYIRYDRRVSLIDGIIDISSIYGDIFNDIIKDCIDKKIKIDYTFRQKYIQDVFEYDGMKQAFYNISIQYRAKKELNRAINKYKDNIIGIMPYKLLNVYITPVVKNHSYIELTDSLNKAKIVIDSIKYYRDNNLNKSEITKLVKKLKL